VDSPTWVGFAPIDDLLGAGNHALVAVSGVGLMAFALFVRVAAGLDPGRSLRGAAVISGADAARIVATIVVVATVDLKARGVVAPSVIGFFVASFALANSTCASRRSESTTRRPRMPPRVRRGS
jgi:hypothetical protein